MELRQFTLETIGNNTEDLKFFRSSFDNQSVPEKKETAAYHINSEDNTLIILNGLNDQQLKAATTLEGNIRLIAGAGTGKTNTLTKRIAYLVAQGVSPSRILSVTFTNKAAHEMRERAANLLGVPEDVLHMQTFHSLCSNILREDIHVIGWDRNFNLGTDSIFNSIIRDVLDVNGGNKLDENTYEYLLKRIKNYISSMRRNVEEDYVRYLVNCSLPDLPSLDEVIAYELKKEDDKKNGITHVRGPEPSPTNKYVCHIFAYQKRLGYLSFDDLIRVTCYLFHKYPKVLHKWQNKYDYVQCDEFQDTDEYQFDIIKMLSESHGNCFVVGDPDQAIYGFRSAKPDILNHLDKRLPNVQTIIMDKNYRCKGEIIDVGNNIIKSCPDRIEKDLQPMRGYSGEKVEVLQSPDALAVGKDVGQRIKALIESGWNPKDIAVLYRAANSKHIPALIDVLQSENIPVIVWDSKDCMETIEFECVQNILELLVNPNNTIAISNLLSNIQGIENTREVITIIKCLSSSMSAVDSFLQVVQQNLIRTLLLDRVTALAHFFMKYKILDNIPINSFVSDIHSLLSTLFKENSDNVFQLVLSRIHTSKYTTLDKSFIATLLENILLDNSDANPVETPNAVQFMTIHKSKGLEFPIVFCLDVNYKVFPSYRASDIAEEFRIAYVAYTRAKEKLYISTSLEPVTKTALKKPSVMVTQLEKDYLILPDKIVEEWDDLKQYNYNEIKGKLFKECTESSSLDLATTFA